MDPLLQQRLQSAAAHQFICSVVPSSVLPPSQPQGLVFTDGQNPALIANMPTFGNGDFTLSCYASLSPDSSLEFPCAVFISGLWLFFQPIDPGGQNLLHASIFGYDGVLTVSTPVVTGLSYDTFYHLVAVRSGNDFTIYCNNVAGTSETSEVTLTNQVGEFDVLGGQTLDPGGMFIGSVKNVACYSRAISTEEISQLYAADGDPAAISTTGLILAPDRNQPGAGTTWYDTSPQLADITIDAGVNWLVPS